MSDECVPRLAEEPPRELDVFGSADVRASPAGRVERVRRATMVYSLHRWSDSYESRVEGQRGKYVRRGTSGYSGCRGGRRGTGYGTTLRGGEETGEH